MKFLLIAARDFNSCKETDNMSGALSDSVAWCHLNGLLQTAVVYRHVENMLLSYVLPNILPR